MDSLTQAVLGAGIGYVVGGRALGRKAALWGLALGTLPDLDVFIPHADPVDNFVKHRSWSHSWLLQSLVAVPFGMLITKLHGLGKDQIWRMSLLAWLALVTHALLDSMTTYGTQVFWPLTTYPVGVGSVAIIDPLYTLPLLIGTIWVFIAGKRNWAGRAPMVWKASVAALVVSTLYLGWGMAAQQQIKQAVAPQLAAKAIKPDAIFTSPTMGNSLLWTVLVREGDQVHYGMRSILDPKNQPLELAVLPRNSELLDMLPEAERAKAVMSFSKGFYGFEKNGDQIRIRDLRMGNAPDFVFTFALAKQGSEAIQRLVPSLHIRPSFDSSLFSFIWDRMFDPLARPANAASSEKPATSSAATASGN